jgi:alanine racemase
MRPMPASPHVSVHIDLARVRQNVNDVRRRAGRAEVHAVVKADAYGLGATEVALAIADFVDGYVVFDAAEAAKAGLAALGKPILALGPSDLDLCLAHGVRPAVWSVEQARAMRAAGPALSVDTGMQRFACPPDEVERALEAGGCREALTHATNVDAVRRLLALAGGRGLRLHAAGSALLDEPAAQLDLVRPGLALYRGAVSVRTRCVEVRDSKGPVGYTGFAARRHGVILAGYSHGLRPGPCLVDGKRREVAEVGMQSAFVALEPGDAGAEVVLLGDGLGEDQVAAEWGTTPHEALLHLARMGVRQYTNAAAGATRQDLTGPGR